MIANPQEGMRLFRQAVRLVKTKYGPWINQNPYLKYFDNVSDDNLSVVLKFRTDAQYIVDAALQPNQSICNARAFTQYLHGTPEVYVRMSITSPPTLVHELLHVLTHNNFHKAIKGPLNEGVTEYFTRKIQGSIADDDGDDNFLASRGHTYLNELALVLAIRKFVKEMDPPSYPPLPPLPNTGQSSRTPPSPQPRDTKNWLKKAYFSGDQAMIDLFNMAFAQVKQQGDFPVVGKQPWVPGVIPTRRK